MSGDDGGPAFPQAETRSTSDHGMTLRDYFAGQALAGLVQRMNADAVRKYRDGTHDGREAYIAYVIADAMLAERVE